MGFFDKMKEGSPAGSSNKYAAFPRSQLRAMLDYEEKKMGPFRNQKTIDEMASALAVMDEEVNKQKAAEAAAKNAAMEAAGIDPQHVIGSNLNLTDLSKLSFLSKAPHNISDERVAAIAGKAPMLGRDKWQAKIENAKLAYLYVVEANSALLAPGKEPLPAVFVMAKDEAYMTNKEFLYQVGDKISELRGTGAYSPKYKEFFKMLNNAQSHMWYDLGDEITGGPEVACFSDSLVEAKKLPNGFLPTDRIVPVLVTEVDTKPTYLMIPGDMYKA